MRTSIEDMLNSTPIMSNRLAVVPSSRVDAPNPRRPMARGTETLEEARIRNAIRSPRSYYQRQLDKFFFHEQVHVWTMRNEPIGEQNVLLETRWAASRWRR